MPASPRRPADAARPPSAAARAGSALRRDDGQATLLLVAVLCAVLVGAWVVVAIARGLLAHGDHQRAADLAALSAARAMRDAYPRLFEPPVVDGRPNPAHLERAAYLAIGIRAGEGTAQRNGAERVAVAFPNADPVAPTRVRVTVSDPIPAGGDRRVTAVVTAEAELSPPGHAAAASAPTGDEYDGPFATRQGKRMRPDVAQAFDRMATAAAHDGVALVITSAFRSNAEQARLFAAHPDPQWVARPGTSLHRLGTELDLGPPSAYGWLAHNAPRFHFVMRYAREPWHFGMDLNARSRGAADGARGGVPSFVPERYAQAFAAAAQRWNVSATLLAAQAYRESGFNPFARSPAGALGIAQLMPGTARALGVADPLDPRQAIDAQAHLMRDHLRRFASVALALAAYNAGPARVAACLCVPPIPETQAYVAAILGMLAGAGDPTGAPTAALEIRLVH